MATKKKRPYRKRKRAEAEEETRRRITEAAVELHGTVGPANTKVMDVAELAGVSRMTVYNHFPTDAELFHACSSHWERQNPFPEPATWLRHEDPGERLARALHELYQWYDEKQGMLGNVLRDAPLVPSLSTFMDEYWGGFMDAVMASLARGWPEEEEQGGTEVRAALRLAVDFNTWHLLTSSGMSSARAADLAVRMVSAVSERS